MLSTKFEDFGGSLFFQFLKYFSNIQSQPPPLSPSLVRRGKLGVVINYEYEISFPELKPGGIQNNKSLDPKLLSVYSTVGLNLFNLSALLTTVTLLAAMAAAAIIGFNSIPKTG